MDKIDVRRVSKDGQQMLRRQVIAARKEGVTYVDIQARYGVQPGTACAWWRRYQAEGASVVELIGGAARPAVSAPEYEAKHTYSSFDSRPYARPTQALVCLHVMRFSA